MAAVALSGAARGGASVTTAGAAGAAETVDSGGHWVGEVRRRKQVSVVSLGYPKGHWSGCTRERTP